MGIGNLRRTKREEMPEEILEEVEEQESELEEPEEKAPQDLSSIEFKSVNRQRKVHRKKHYFLRFLVFLCIIAGIFVFLKSSFFSVKNITVSGNKYYTDSEVISMAKLKSGVNLIFDVEAGSAEERLLENPYFADVRIKRKFPGTLEIVVTERTQYAAVVYGDSYIIIDGDGLVLRKSDLEPEITVISGLTIDQMDVGEALGVEEKDTLSMVLRMLSAMTEGDMYFKRIDASKMVVRAYIYDALLVKGTPNEIVKAMQDGELQKVIQDLFDNGINRGTLIMGGSDYISFTPELDIG